MSEVVRFSASCPTCHGDANWVASRRETYESGAPVLRILSPVCGDSDPVVVLVKALGRNEGAA